MQIYLKHIIKYDVNNFVFLFIEEINIISIRLCGCAHFHSCVVYMPCVCVCVCVYATTYNMCLVKTLKLLL